MQQQEIERLKREHREFTEQVLAANGDLGDRIRAMPRSVAYDPDVNILIVTLGEVQEAILHGLTQELYLRLDPDSMEVVGLEILDAAQMAESPELARLIAAVLPLRGADIDQFVVELRQMAAA